MPKINDGGVSREMTPDELKAYEKTQSLIRKEEEERVKVQYKENRRISYPDIGEQLDALYHAGVFPKEMADKIKAVKDANPKPT